MRYHIMARGLNVQSLYTRRCWPLWAQGAVYSLDFALKPQRMKGRLFWFRDALPRPCCGAWGDAVFECYLHRYPHRTRSGSETAAW